MMASLEESNASAQHEKLGLVLVLLVGGGLIIAALFWAITNQYELIYFSALIPAIAGFVLMCYAIWQGRIRGRLFTLILGLILGLLIYSTYQVLRYVSIRRAVIATYETKDNESPDEANLVFDQMLAQETGDTGFIGYLRYQLQYGITISATNPLFGPSNQVTGPGVLFYWLYDLVVILGGTLTAAWWANNRAYCEHCHTYYGRIKSSGGDVGCKKSAGWITTRRMSSNACSKSDTLSKPGHCYRASSLDNRRWT